MKQSPKTHKKCKMCSTWTSAPVINRINNQQDVLITYHWNVIHNINVFSCHDTWRDTRTCRLTGSWTISQYVQRLLVSDATSLITWTGVYQQMRKWFFSVSFLLAILTENTVSKIVRTFSFSTIYLLICRKKH